ncbi:MAG: thymidine kinase [Flavobacteriia bacterium]|nr:thymidine kinase [Flavobacteriia bacterium]
MFLENTVNHKHHTGWVEVICGSMFSGKTEELLRRLNRALIGKQKVEIFKPAVDKRYHDSHVVSHDNKSVSSTVVESAENILLHVSQDVDVVGIDEAQFFDDAIIEVVNDLANRGIRVVIAGLDMDFEGKPFGPMPHLMAIAEYVTKVHAICVHTGNLAHYSHRTVSDQKTVLLGEKNEYEPVSRAAFLKLRAEQKKKE